MVVSDCPGDALKILNMWSVQTDLEIWPRILTMWKVLADLEIWLKTLNMCNFWLTWRYVRFRILSA
jgi:hypothetical protein